MKISCLKEIKNNENREGAGLGLSITDQDYIIMLAPKFIINKIWFAYILFP
ncbi:MAG: hypothetical protein LBP57_01260 [Endomicrobium sp.]|jgi:hypothetical protein|nr:hypothetical protein [Endomicrobium sp.]